MNSEDAVIRSVDVFDLEFPVAHPVGPSGATYDRRGAILIRLEDETGQVGWGETYRRVTTLAALNAIAANLVGRAARARRAIVSGLGPAIPDRLAVSALSIALDDLRARQLGVPIAELYGGAVRAAVPAYASSGGYRSDLEPEITWPTELEQAR